MNKAYKRFFKQYLNKINKKEKNIQPIDPVIFIELIISGLNSGNSITKILKTISEISNIHDFNKIIIQILLGMKWKETYKNTFIDKNYYYKQIFQVLEINWEKGTSPINSLQKLKNQIQTLEEKNLDEKISKLSTKITLPLGVCYLPSFICLGLLPVIISSGGNLTS